MYKINFTLSQSLDKKKKKKDKNESELKICHISWTKMTHCIYVFYNFCQN